MLPDLLEAYSEEYEEEYRYKNYFPEELMASVLIATKIVFLDEKEMRKLLETMMNVSQYAEIEAEERHDLACTKQEEREAKWVDDAVEEAEKLNKKYLRLLGDPV